MTEDNGNKIETEYHAVIDTHLEILETGTEGKDYLITAIGTGKKCVQKYQLVAEVPNIEQMTAITELDEWFKSARDASLQDVVNMAVKNMFTRPAYDALVDRDIEPVTTEDPKNSDNPFVDFPLVENGHAQMQELLDAYRVGAKKAVGQTVKQTSE